MAAALRVGNGTNASTFARAGFEWNTYENELKTPSPHDAPSLPSVSWQRPKSLFNAVKRLPPVFAPPETCRLEENADREEPEQRRLEEKTSGREEPATRPPFGPESSSRNQEEEKDALPSSSSILLSALVTPTSATEGFFKPWKHTREEPINDRDVSASPGHQNKWKSRAIINPFAKKRDKRGGFIPPAACHEEALVPQPPPQPIGLRSIPRRQKFHVPLSRQDQQDESPTAEEEEQQQQQKPYQPRGGIAEEPQKESTPVDDSASPSVRLSSRHLRRIKGFDQASLSAESINQSTVERSPGNNGQDTEGSVEENALRLPPPHHLSPHKHATSNRRLLNPLPVVKSKLDLNEVNEPECIAMSTSTKRPLALKPLRPPAGVKPKCKLSTMEKLAEIKRKRDERRVLQDQEKQRIRDELEEHGDDNGFKFRRLIQKYRESVGVLSTAKVTLPPLSVSDGTSPSLNTVNRLSVFIRKRPLAKKELKAKGYDVITCLSDGNRRPPVASACKNQLVCHEPKLKVDLSESIENHVFGFDGVFDETEPNDSVYAVTVGPLMPSLLQNGNLTVFAYGQTGSGKTYTMKSIYRQVGGDLFREVDKFQAAKPTRKVEIGACFYEIYMNNVNDLLNERKRVTLMEDAEGVVQLMGIEEKRIENAEELQELVTLGENSRATSANAVHDDSSRSHALLRVCVYDSSSHDCLAQICMVDLAGSERACDMQTDGKHTRMEGAEINKSLLALKECIRALDRGATHVPFRQSKLTQLLRDSFVKANSKTVMIATISPCSDNSNHTLNTLRYADRLKEISSST